jgi:hypothetical protein
MRDQTASRSTRRCFSAVPTCSAARPASSQTKTKCNLAAAGKSAGPTPGMFGTKKRSKKRVGTATIALDTTSQPESAASSVSA